MKRLTGRRDGRAYIVGCPDFALPKIVGLIIQQTVDRLAVYEDTGLEPEEIISATDMAKIACALHELNAYKELGPIDRLHELAQADREGRCVVLPCKKGDTVWRIVHDAVPHITKDRCTDIEYEKGDIWVHLIGDRAMGGWNFGKLLFLTRAEAEAALRREQE